MSRSSRDSQERSRELRAALGCVATERTIAAARRLVAERDALKRRVEDLEKALALAWAENERAAE